MSARTPQRQTRSRSTEPPAESPTWHVSVGFLFIVAALFYFLALVSYDPADLPTWCHLALSDTATPMAHNLIGRLGAVMAGYTFWMFGGANYIIPACLTWFGVCKLASHTKITLRSWVGFCLMIVCGAGILYLQNFWEWDNHRVTPYGAGGGLGHVVAGILLLGILGEVGSLLVMGVIYLVGMIFVTGMHPVQVLVQGKDMAGRAFVNWWTERQRRRLEAEEEAILPLSAPPPAKTRGRKKAAAAAMLDDEEEKEFPSGPATQLELPEVHPLPKIIDSSFPKEPKAKPQLAEVWQKRQAQKDERALFAKPASLTARYKGYSVPPLDLLQWPEVKARTPADEAILRETQSNIIKTLSTFGINVTPGDITKGPAITRYEVYPSEGLRVSRIANLEADIARATKAERLNILAPIPGKDTVGIELPNRDKIVVPIRELLEDDEFQKGKAKLPLALGKDVYGKAIIADLATMPHLLVAGATGSGKSVCINSIITSLLCRFAPDELRFIMIDPKVVEMQGYKDLPHLALPVVTDPKQALLALRWVVNEMEKRYQIFAQEGCRNFETFNNRKSSPRTTSRVGAGNKAKAVPVPAAAPVLPDDYDPMEEEPDFRTDTTDASVWAGSSEPPKRKEPELEIPDSMPYIVVIVDELADLMQTAPADIEVAIARIAQKARAAGIHLILATQTPRADVVTGIIKANVPSRIAFQVASALDSRVILDRKGADRLVGKGDMLYLPPGTSQLIRAQGTMVTDDELHDLVDHACAQGKPVFEATLADSFDEMDGEGGEEVTPEDEAILEKVLDVISTEKKASTSLIQRRLRLGYTRAARMMDILEERGIIGPGEGAKPREILVEL
ncbi:DNA translocase FtsK [Verrucomicrobium spinosum]|uniref:DNA translocase FtsK n=1 Tax=Verrucomicrobium spinosum TaxID=2736 RepID=UPI0001745DB0|nr:DNA translocase FtsK [Verrucomicrobium spinosum]